MKRKRELDDEDVPIDDDNDPKADPPSKRAKAEPSVIKKNIPSERTESQVLKPRTTAAVRATKHYRAKKGKASSPLVDSAFVNYDEIPDVPPTSSVHDPSEIDSPPIVSKRAGKKPPEDTKQTPTIAKRTRGAKAALKTKDEQPTTVSNSKQADGGPVLARADIPDTIKTKVPSGVQGKSKKTDVNPSPHNDHPVEVVSIFPFKCSAKTL